MRGEVEQNIKKLRNIIEDGKDILKANELAEKMRISTGTVYKYIRMLKERGFGIYATPDGYLPSSQARKNDDVRFLRRINGYHISSQFALAAAKKDIMARWRGETERKLLSDIIQPMSMNTKLLKEARTKLLEHSSKLLP